MIQEYNILSIDINFFKYTSDDEAGVFYLTLVNKFLLLNMIIHVMLFHSIIIVLRQYYLYKLVSL